MVCLHAVIFIRKRILKLYCQMSIPHRSPTRCIFFLELWYIQSTASFKKEYFFCFYKACKNIKKILRIQVTDFKLIEIKLHLCFHSFVFFSCSNNFINLTKNSFFWILQKYIFISFISLLYIDNINA